MNKALRLAVVGHKHLPSREGGVEIVVEELSTRMAKKGLDVTCYNRKNAHVCGDQYEILKSNNYKGIKIKEVPTINRKGFAALTSSFFGAIFSAFGKYDVVHFHAEGTAFFCWLPRILGKKVIVTVHGLDWKRDKWGKMAKTYIMLGEKSAVKFAHEIIVLSENVQNYFLEKYKRNTKFIPNGVNPPVLHEADLIHKKFGLNKDDYFLYLGRIVPEKGIQYLIEAYQQLNTEKKLVIAGGASDTDEFYSKLKQMALSDKNIIFTDFVDGQILDELFSNAYVYVQPSDIEGMSLSLLEAMSYGNCCVVSSIPECANVVEDKAIIFKKQNIKELAEKLQYLSDHKDFVSKYKGEASEYICKKYNWDDVVAQTIDLYK